MLSLIIKLEHSLLYTWYWTVFTSHISSKGNVLASVRQCVSVGLSFCLHCSPAKMLMNLGTQVFVHSTNLVIFLPRLQFSKQGTSLQRWPVLCAESIFLIPRVLRMLIQQKDNYSGTVYFTLILAQISGPPLRGLMWIVSQTRSISFDFFFCILNPPSIGISPSSFSKSIQNHDHHCLSHQKNKNKYHGQMSCIMERKRPSFSRNCYF